MEYKDKRIHPPIWQHDYHVLTKMYRVIGKIVNSLGNIDLVVDYGCGDMPYKHLFTKHVKKYTGADIGSNGQADILVKENQKLPLKDTSADMILSTQVLEHVRDTDFYMKESHRILRSKGKFLVSTHGVWPYHEYPLDFHRWTRTGLEQLISKYGFRIVKTWPILTGFSMTLQLELLLYAGIFQKWGTWGKIPYALISLSGNILIYFLDRFFYDKQAYDASVYVVLAEKK